MSVIVTNAKNRIAYNIAKSLSKKGITVYTCDFVPLSMSFTSRYSKGHFIYPSPFQYQKEFIECLLTFIKKLKATVLIPVFEETFLISKYKDTFKDQVKMVIPDYDQILLAHSKHHWAPLAKSLNIPVPAMYSIEDLRKLKSIIKTLQFPVLIKPKQGGGAYGIRYIHSPSELESLLGQVKYLDRPWDRFFIQEVIHGETHCVAMLFRNGECRAKATYKQIRDYPTTGGQATLRVGIRNETASNYLEELLKTLKWHGVCQADFIVEKGTGVPYLIDLNPRFWGSLLQAIVSGVDFPYLLYRIATEGDVHPVNNHQTGVMTRWIGGDLRGLLQYCRNSNNKPLLLRNFFFPGYEQIYYDDFDITDPLPFFTWCIDSIYKIIKQKTLKPTTHESLAGIWE